MTTTTLEGAWDCSDCTEKGIPGLVTRCPACGDPRNAILTPGEAPYLPDNARVITDEAELAQSNSGPEWNCDKCNVVNPGDEDQCSACGDPRAFDDTVNRRVTYDNLAEHHDTAPDPRDEMVEMGMAEHERRLKAGQSPRTLEDLTLTEGELPTTHDDVISYEKLDFAADKAKFERDQENALPPFVRWFRAHRKHVLIGAIACVVIALIYGIVSIVRYYTATEAGTVTVSTLHWKHSVEVEEFRTLDQGDWTYPSDARVLNSQTRIRTYVTVTIGYRTEFYTDYESRPKTVPYSYDCSYTISKGNGTFDRVSRSCSGTRIEYDRVPVPKSREIPITRQDPVYDTWYTYQIDRWQTDRWIDASGDKPKPTYWPEGENIAKNTQSGDQIGEERIGDERRATYTIDYVDTNGGTHSESDNSDVLWNRLTVDQIVPAEYYLHNGDLASVNW